MKNTDKALLGVLIITIIALIGAIIYVSVMPKAEKAFTEFYILNQDGKASDYPSSLVVNQPAKIMLGVVNHEGRSLNYRIQVTVNGAIINSQEVGVLADGQKWEQQLDLVLKQAGEKQRVEFTLYTDKETSPHIKDPLALLINVLDQK